ncbi:MAG: LptF/LptG family permease [Thermodesulfovibrio sp.]|nr:LptF/LptG family permease [Thermodesulfovibrio sp.]MDW7998222.1 LptF/LptG family permease [Thermodesulfovibrio sp.]
MKVIYRALTLELIQNIGLSIAFLNAVLLIEKFFKLSKIFASVGIDLPNLLLIIIFLQPQLLIFTLPMGLLLGVLLTYGRTQTDNEMTIFMVSGMPYKRAFKPAIYIGLTTFFFTTIISFYVAPTATSLVREKILTLLAERAPLGLEEGVFNRGFKDITIFVKEKPDSLHLKEIIIFDERKYDIKIIIAKEGLIKKERENINLSLHEGKAYFSKGLSLYELSFKEYIFKLSPNIDPIAKKINEFSLLELISKIQTEKAKVIDYKLELYRRLTLPLLCIVCVFLAPPLCLILGRTGRMGGITVGLGIFAAYYILMIYGANLAKTGKVSVEMGTLIPFMVMVFLAIFMYTRIRK